MRRQQTITVTKKNSGAPRAGMPEERAKSLKAAIVSALKDNPTPSSLSLPSLL